MIKRILQLIAVLLLSIICMPYILVIAIIDIWSFVLNADHYGYYRLEAFSEWFNKQINKI
jgi:hypothetical protein